MRTYADRLDELNERRYTDEAGSTRHHDASTDAGAKAILSSRGGKKAAQLALAQLWEQAKQPGHGFLPTARISAPLYVLRALQTLGLIEEAEDERGKAIRFRLTFTGKQQARAALNRGAAA